MRSRSLVQCTVAFAAFAVMACNSKAPTQPGSIAPATPPAATVRTPGLVFGRVIDLQTNSGVAGVTLRWQPSNTSVVTDASGAYQVSLPVWEHYSVTADRPQISGNVRLTADPRPTDLVVNSPACPMQYGIVVDNVTKQPIAGARVEWSLAEPFITDKDGVYTLSVECRTQTSPYRVAGTTLIRITHPDYQSYMQPSMRSESAFVNKEAMRMDFALVPK